MQTNPREHADVGSLLDPLWRRAMRITRSVARDLTALLLPVACPGCGAQDLVICTECLALFARGAYRTEATASKLNRTDPAPVLPVWSLAAYAATARQVVLAWKNHQRADLSPFLATLLAIAASEVVQGVRAAAAAHGPAASFPRVLVVPMPSSAANQRRRRGHQPVLELATGVVAGLEATGQRAAVADVLMQRRGVRDQVGLSRRQRQQNLQHGLALKRRAVIEPNSVILLVDDILTTGSTIAAAEQILTRIGAVPVGAVTLAATPGKQNGTFGLPDLPASG